MNTARKFPSLAAVSTSLPAMTLWLRIGTAIRAVWTRSPKPSAAILAAGRESRLPPIAGKVATISIAGRPLRLARQPQPRLAHPAKGASAPQLRRPGVQGRWKASDRVAL